MIACRTLPGLAYGTLFKDLLTVAGAGETRTALDGIHTDSRMRAALIFRYN